MRYQQILVENYGNAVGVEAAVYAKRMGDDDGKPLFVVSDIDGIVLDGIVLDIEAGDSLRIETPRSVDINIRDGHRLLVGMETYDREDRVLTIETEEYQQDPNTIVVESQQV